MKKLNWKIIINYITRFLLLINISIMLGVYFQIEKINKISNNINGVTVKQDTTIINNVIASFDYKTDFVYIDANKIRNSLLINDKYYYNTKIPEQISNGYLTLFENNIEGGKFFIWSSQEIDIKNINGWCLSPNMGKYQHDTTYYSVLIPIVKR